MKKLRTYPGQHILSTCQAAVATAERHPLRIVGFDFNGVIIRASAGENPQELVDFYDQVWRERAEAYRNSPEGREAARKQQEADRIAEQSRRQGLHRFTRRDEKAWVAWKVANLDGGYGEAILRYASRWAALMENSGLEVSEVADSASHEADTEGITGFMYSAAVSVLSSCWVHGEQLRKWHNLKNQVHTEGEKANADGGVLNTALLSIG